MAGTGAPASAAAQRCGSGTRKGRKRDGGKKSNLRENCISIVNDVVLVRSVSTSTLCFPSLRGTRKYYYYILYLTYTAGTRVCTREIKRKVCTEKNEKIPTEEWLFARKYRYTIKSSSPLPRAIALRSWDLVLIQKEHESISQIFSPLFIPNSRNHYRPTFREPRPNIIYLNYYIVF